MSSFTLQDPQGRTIDYLRLAVTDRCNLRCTYCMPDQGLQWLHRDKHLTDEEIIRLLTVFHALGIKKVRLTGGEPFMRPGFMALLQRIHAALPALSLALTTNGSFTRPHLSALQTLGIEKINLSLDSLDPQRFAAVTRRDGFQEVFACLMEALQKGFKVRINAVIREGQNDDDILPLASFTQHHKVDVRFIEEMPFNGSGDRHRVKWTDRALIDHLLTHFPDMQRERAEPNATSVNYRIPGHLGRVGVIAAFSRNFCSTCNRIRLTPSGEMKNCLYGDGVLSLRDLLRNGASDDQLKKAIAEAVLLRAADGFEAEKLRSSGTVKESMATIGG